MTLALPVEFRQPILLLSAFLAIPVYLWARSDGGRVLFSSFRLLPQGGTTWRMRLAFLPPLLVALLNWMDPEWLKPLSSNFIGYIISAIAVVFWVAAVFLARKILAVDI